MPHEHAVRSFDEELRRLKRNVLDMGERVKRQIAASIEALVRRDRDLAARVIESDAGVNAMEKEIHRLAVRLFALRQPMAIDLRSIIAALKISTDLERIGDYAANVSKHISRLNSVQLDMLIPFVQKMAGVAESMLAGALEAYDRGDAVGAIEVRERDSEIDALYIELLAQLNTYIAGDPQHVKVFAPMILVAKCMERAGDHTTNICEHIYFMVQGETFSAGNSKEAERLP